MNQTLSNPVSQYQKPPISGSVIAVIMVIVVEVMFFGGLISAFILARAGQIEWPPAGQPRLPFALTFGNMLILLSSAVTMWLYIKSLKNKTEKTFLLNLTIILGVIFFIIQGYEWARIIFFGIQTPHTIFGSFFYTIIGLHGFHVLIGLSILFYIWKKSKKSNLEVKYNYALTAGLFWFFVVALWPIFYSLIYLD